MIPFALGLSSIACNLGRHMLFVEVVSFISVAPHKREVEMHETTKDYGFRFVRVWFQFRGVVRWTSKLAEQFNDAQCEQEH